MNPKSEFKNRLCGQFKNLLAVRAGVLLLCLAAANNPVFPAVVTNCTEADLRAAMAGGGAVTFACDGTITLTDTITNGFNTVLDGSGHQITVSGNNSVRVFYVPTNVSFSIVNLTIANGFSTNGAGIFNDGGLLTLSGVAFQTNVAQTLTGPASEGGGIFNRAGTINATNCVFTGNLASAPATNYNEAHGGAIRNESGLVNLENCSLTANQACGGGGVAGTAPGDYGTPGGNGDGGAIHNSGTLSVSSCSFTQNSAAGGPGAYDLYDIGWNGSTPGGAGSGAAIFNSGVATIKGGTFSGNAAAGGAGGSSFYPRTGLRGGSGSGGAIYNYGSVVVQDSAFLANSALGGGGGAGGRGGWHISLSGGGGGDGGDGSGGAICNLGSSVIQSSSIVNNTSVGGFGGRGGDGDSQIGANGGNGGNGGSGCGGIWGFVQMTNCTVALNYGYGGSAGVGGAGGYSRPLGSPGANGANGANGVAVGCLSASGSRLINTLLAGNTPTNCSGVITDLGHNLSSDGSCNFTNIGSMNDTDPELGPLADNGGPTLTMALLPGSPAIDAGDNSAAQPTDQRGFPRIVGPNIDIGAYERCYLPVLQISPPQTNVVSILVYGLPDQSCRLMTSSTLANWLPIATNQIGTNGMIVFQDNCGLGQTCHFYRVVSP